jgi:Tat protein translocase TatB subunit
MFGIGIGEWILLGIVALIVIGPEKFPDFMKVVIRTTRDLRGYLDEMKTEVSKELTPLKEELNPLKSEMDSLSRIDPESYIDSLTSGDADESSETADNPVINEEDKKVMAAADDENFDDDPYGWQEGEDSDHKADKGAYPEDTVGYGDEGLQEDADEGQETSGEEASANESESTGEVQDGPSDGAGSPDLEYPDDDRIETAGDGEPDVWTGR